MLGKLTPEEIDRFLLDAQFAHLACHADGQSYIVPVSFAVEGETSLVGQTTIGKKIEVMRKNPEVCLCVDEIKDLTDWQSVVLWGRFEELSGIAAGQAMCLLIDKYGPIFEDMNARDRQGRVVTPPRLDNAPVPAIVYRIVISERTGRFERR